MKKLFQASCLLALSLALSGCATATKKKTATTETLARHETVAEFQGTNYHRCLGMTSFCPDQCGQSGTMANFKIITYVSYEKLGEYGDPKSDTYLFLVEDNMGHLKVPAAIRDATYALKQGDTVLLSWNHDYVTIDGSSGPERPITKLEALKPDQNPD